MKTYSFKKQLFQIFILLFAVTILGMSTYAGYFSYSSQRRTYTDIRQLLNLYNEQTSDNLKSVDYFLMELTNYSSDISSVALLDNVEGSYSSLIRISKMFEFNLRSFPCIQGMFTYFPKSNAWVGYSNNLASTNSFHPFIKQQFQNEDFITDIKDTNGLKWIPYDHEGKTYLIKAFMYNNSVVGAWTDLSTLSSSLSALNDMNAMVIFTDKDGKVHNIEGTSTESNEVVREIKSKNTKLDIPAIKSLSSSTVMNLLGKRYLVTSQELNYCDYIISVLVPMEEISQASLTFFKYSLLYILAVCSIFGLIVFLFYRLTNHAMGLLSSMSNAIVSGDSENRIDISSERCEEVIHVATSYNNMVDSLQKYKVNAYEERIQKKNYQLLFLRSQVAPHFLINCLNMVSYLADGTAENTRILRQMIDTLSKHLRYTLSTDDKVPLSRELQYLENYVELSKVRFPGCITYETDFDDSAMDAQVFPLILIMFTENTFKFNLVMGEPLTVKVSTRLTKENDVERLHITHIDSGEGYSQDVLDFFEGKRENMESHHNKAQIGMSNIVHRLELFYNETAEIKFSNEEGMGARVDIDIPYVPYKQPENGKKDHGVSIIS